GQQSNLTLTPIPAGTAPDVIYTTKGTEDMGIGGGGKFLPSKQMFFYPPHWGVIHPLGETEPATPKRPPIPRKEEGASLAGRNPPPSYGFAAFTVDPGSQRGDFTTIKVTYYDVAGPDGRVAPFETFMLRRPRRD